MSIRAFYHWHCPSAVGLTLGLLFGCGGDTEVFTYDDEGVVCLSSQQTALTAHVTFDCFPSSCHTVKSSKCEAVVVGDEIVITSSAVVESYGTDCTSDCKAVEATCSVPAPPAGAYSIVHGNERRSALLPVGPRRAINPETGQCY